MRRDVFIERALRQIYGEQPNDDAQITINLVNTWIEDAIAVAAKTNYTDNIKLDGIAYVNGGFYATFKGIEIEPDETFLWKITLPHTPVGIGSDEGISTLQLKDSESKQLSHPLVWLSQSQKGFYKNLRPIPSKTLCYQEGGFVYAISTILLNQYTANVTMISGGDPTDLDSELNVPPDYLPVMVEYIKNQLIFQRNVPKDQINDGVDDKTTA